MGRPSTAIKASCEKRNINHGNAGKMRLYYDRNWLYRKYWQEKLTILEMAIKCNVYSRTITYWMDKYEIKRRSMSEVKKGIPLTEEHKRKLSEAHKGKSWGCHTKETKRKIGEANSRSLKGRILSTEHKMKISESLKGGNSTSFTSERSKKILLNYHRQNPDIVANERNPQWRGGISREPYGWDFSPELKTQIRKRDNYTCQMLDCNAIQNGKKFPVHHADYCKTNNIPSNLITLCHSHHTKSNFNREYWENYFTSL